VSDWLTVCLYYIDNVSVQFGRIKWPLCVLSRIHVLRFTVIKNCFGVAASYPFCVGIRGSATSLFQNLGIVLPISRMSQKKPRWQGSFDKVYCPGNRLWIETTGETTAHSLSGQQPVYEEVPGEYLGAPLHSNRHLPTYRIIEWQSRWSTPPDLQLSKSYCHYFCHKKTSTLS